jgi:hypothetical protein
VSAVFPVNVADATLDKQADCELKDTGNTGEIKKSVIWSVLAISPHRHKSHRFKMKANP